MNSCRKKRRAAFGEPPTEKYMTLVDEQIKNLIHKQLQTELTLKDELNQPNKFTESVLMKDESHQKGGIKSLVEFQMLEQLEEEVVKLREASLTEQEIILKLNASEAGSEIFSKKLDIIDQKIEIHKSELAKHRKSTGTISVSRKVFELNQATYNNSTASQPFKHLVCREEKVYPINDPITSTLKDYGLTSKDYESTSKDVSENKVSGLESNFKSANEYESFIGPMLAHINQRAIQIPENIIKQNQIDLTSILSMKRFQNYKAGSPTKILYIKNLSKNTQESSLAELFARFCVNDYSEVKYQVMRGPMRGQAFVTFVDKLTAQRALLLCNGFILNGRPMIIAFGKSSRN